MCVNYFRHLCRRESLRFFAALSLLTLVPCAARGESEILVKYFDLTKGRIAFTYTLQDKKEIYILDFATLVAKPVITSNGDNEYPRFSKDGSKLLFTSTRTGDSEIYVANSDGTGVKQLTNSKGADYDGDWSPDGKRIVFLTQREPVPDLAVINADGSGFESVNKLTEGKEYATPRWSPDGNELMFATTEYWPGWDLLSYDFKTKRITVLTTGNLSATRPAYDPTGANYSYSFGSKEDTDIFIHKHDTGAKPVQAVTQPGLDLDSDWMNDHTFLYVSETKPKTGHFEIFLYDSTKRESIQITECEGVIRNVSWTPTSIGKLGKDKPAKESLSDSTVPGGPPDMIPSPLPSPAASPNP